MSKFTTQNYTAIASVLADSIEQISEPDVIALVAENFADMLRADNPRFNRELFLEAAGVTDFWRNLGPKRGHTVANEDGPREPDPRGWGQYS